MHFNEYPCYQNIETFMGWFLYTFLRNCDVHFKEWIHMVIPPGWGTICDGVNCYIRKCTI